MSKYAPLQKYLSQLERDEWKASFDEIEKILRFKLPHSAYHHPAWWGNNKQGSRHTSAWLDIDWATRDLNFGNGTIAFFRNNKQSSSRKEKRVDVIDMDIHTWDSPLHLQVELAMQWTPLGKILLAENDKLGFPKAADKPALYRFRLRKNGEEFFYVGETNNLQRRLGNYRNPGASQKTSIRINKILKDKLKKGYEIALSVITLGNAWFVTSQTKEEADLTSKTVRCLFENAAILKSRSADIECLNEAD